MGSILFGGVDGSKYEHPLTSLPILILSLVSM